MIEVGQFCTVKCSRYVDYNIQKGDVVYAAGDTIIQNDEQDVYAYRKLFICARVVDGEVQVHDKPLLMDGVNLKPVSDAKQKKLYAAFEEANKPKED